MSILNFLFGPKETNKLLYQGKVFSIGINYRLPTPGDVIGYGDKAFLLGEDYLFRPYDIKTGKADNSITFDKIPGVW
jgi:hypothetical protein